MATRGDVQEYFDEVIHEVSHKWDDLAQKLGFEENRIKGIRSSERDNDHRCRETLNRWRNREGRRATLQVLQQALIDIGETLTAEHLNVDVKESYIKKVIREASNEWEELAEELGFSYNEIFAIRDLKPDQDRRCREMLTRWRNREGLKATKDLKLQVLKQALIEIDQRRIAESLNEPIELDIGGPEMRALYDQACKDGSYEVFSTLLMLVGKTGNGKSCLKDSLLQLNRIEGSTDGIVITPCLMTGKEKWKITEGEKDPDGEYDYAVAMEMKTRAAKKKEQADEMPARDERPKPTVDTGRKEESVSGKSSEQLTTTDAVGAAPSQHERSKQADNNPDGYNRAAQLFSGKNDLADIVGSKEHPALSIWDFAGQDLYYSNHHVFYTHYAIYILTLNLTNPLDSDLGDKQGSCKEGLQLKTEGDLVDYHVESIRAHTRPRKADEDQKVDNRTPTVVVVGTHKDQVEQKDIEDYFDKLKKHLKGKAINDHVYYKYFAIDNTKRDPEDEEVSELREHIHKIASKQKHMGRKIPISWLQVKSKLMEMEKQGRKYCSLRDVMDATDSSRVPEEVTPEENAVIILRFFHLCGDILYFDTPELHDFVVLDPQWFVDVQKTIITISDNRCDGLPRQWDRLEDEGILEATLIDAVWGNKERQEALKCNLMAHKEELLNMMEQFDIVLQCSTESEDQTSTGTSSLGETTYFVPSLLTKEKDEAMLYPNGPHRSKPIFVSFNDKFFPIGLYHRLAIACMLRYNKQSPMAFSHCAKFITNNDRQTFVITKEQHYLKVELVSSVEEKSACFSHGPDVRKGLDEDLGRIINDWIPGIVKVWCFSCCCEAHKEMEKEEDRFIPITGKWKGSTQTSRFIPIIDEEARLTRKWFSEGKAVCGLSCNTAIEDIGLAHWYQNPGTDLPTTPQSTTQRPREMLTRWRNREGSGATLHVPKQALIHIAIVIAITIAIAIAIAIAPSGSGAGTFGPPGGDIDLPTTAHAESGAGAPVGVGTGAQRGSCAGAPPGSGACVPLGSGTFRPLGSGTGLPTTLQGPKRTILLINDEYGTSKGGISTINYQLGQTLAAANSVVYATALRVPQRDQEAADRDGVQLIGPDLLGKKTEPTLDWLTDYHSVHYPNLPKHVDCIIGHAPITDTAARNIWEQRYPQADLMSFNHVLPEDTEYYKGGRKAMKALQKEEDILDKVNNALAAFSVGQRIYDHYDNMYRAGKKPQSHYIFLPKPSEIFLDTDVTPGGQQKVVLSIGRVRKVEKLKGHDLVAESMGDVVRIFPNMRWRVRGISEDDWETSQKILEDNLKSGDLNPTLLPYGTQEDISNDMKMAHLVLMPSRSEPFGLVGLEAIAAGIPVLISDKTGLAGMIMDLINQRKLHPDHRHVIVETSVNDSDRAKDVKRWADRIVDVLKYSDSAFEKAARLKRELVESRYWEESHRTFLQACGIDPDL